MTTIKLIKEYDQSENSLHDCDAWNLYELKFPKDTITEPNNISFIVDNDDDSWGTLKTPKGSYDLWITDSSRDKYDTFEREWVSEKPINGYNIKFKELTGELIYSKYAI